MPDVILLLIYRIRIMAFSWLVWDVLCVVSRKFVMTSILFGVCIWNKQRWNLACNPFDSNEMDVIWKWRVCFICFLSPWYIITCRSFRGRAFYLFSTTPLSAIVKCDIFWKKCLLYKEDLKDVISKKIVHILLHLYDMACFAGETLSQLNLNKENLILYSHSDALPRGYAEMKFRR